MKQFRYKVRDEAGKAVSGELEATDEASAVRLLRNRRYFIVEVSESQENELSGLMNRFKRVSTDDLVNFTRQLSTMIAAGLPLNEALAILKVQSSQAMSLIVGSIEAEVQGGSSLADAMEVSSNVFPRVYIALVRAGESAGVLDEVLQRLANNLEKQREFRNKTKGALIYPAIVIVGMIVVGAIMMIFVVPKLTEMYADFGAELPLPTQILIWVSNFMVSFWWLLAIVTGIVVWVAAKWSRTDAGGQVIEEFIFKLPILGKLRQQIVLTEFTRTLGLMVGAGISILDGLRIVSEAVGSRIIGRRLIEAAERVEKGQPLGRTLALMPEFPPIVPQMLAVGEQTGKVDEILEKLAIYFEGESETAVKALTTAIEPLIMVVMGIGVGFLIMAVILPIYNLTAQF
jgi:type IV pilus assembly protein PilC